MRKKYVHLKMCHATYEHAINEVFLQRAYVHYFSINRTYAVPINTVEPAQLKVCMYDYGNHYLCTG